MTKESKGNLITGATEVGSVRGKMDHKSQLLLAQIDRGLHVR